MPRILPAAALLSAALSLAACGGEAPPAEGNEAAPAAGNAVEAPAPEANAAAPAAPRGQTEAKVGPASFRYDPAALTPVEAQVSVPPDWTAQVAGLKLIPAERAALIGKAECLYGQSGEASRCNATQESGLAFAMVDQPYDALAAKLTEPAAKPVTLGGRDGVSWTIGAEGEGAEHILLPAGGRTLLIVRQFRATADADAGAVDTALQSLQFEG